MKRVFLFSAFFGCTASNPDFEQTRIAPPALCKNAGLPAPSISEVTPAFGYRDQKVSLTILGTHFQPDAKVKVEGVSIPSVQVLSSTEVKIEIPANPAFQMGLASIQIENPDCQSTERTDVFRFVRPFPKLWKALSVGGYPGEVRLGDFDGDGILDAVTSDTHDPPLVFTYTMPKIIDGIFPNDLKDLILTHLTNLNLDSPDPHEHPQIYDLQPGDFDKDGKLDIAFSISNVGEVWLMRNEGNGHFPTALQKISVGIEPAVLAVFDINQDGNVDMLVTDTRTWQLYVMLADHMGHFSAVNHYEAGISPIAMQLWDINQDGFVDAIIVNRDESKVSFLWGDGQGGFTLGKKVDTCFEPQSIKVADLDEDGHPDLVLSCPSRGGIHLAFGVDFLEPVRTQFISIPNIPWGILVEDFDGDGHKDMVVGNLKDKNVYFLRNRWKQLGTFEPPLGAAAGSLENHTGPLSLQTADINADGLPDLITANYFNFGISLLLSNPSDR